MVTESSDTFKPLSGEVYSEMLGRLCMGFSALEEWSLRVITITIQSTNQLEHVHDISLERNLNQLSHFCRLLWSQEKCRKDCCQFYKKLSLEATQNLNVVYQDRCPFGFITLAYATKVNDDQYLVVIASHWREPGTEGVTFQAIDAISFPEPGLKRDLLDESMRVIALNAAKLYKEVNVQIEDACSKLVELLRILDVNSLSSLRLHFDRLLHDYFDKRRGEDIHALCSGISPLLNILSGLLGDCEVLLFTNTDPATSEMQLIASTKEIEPWVGKLYLDESQKALSLCTKTQKMPSLLYIANSQTVDLPEPFRCVVALCHKTIASVGHTTTAKVNIKTHNVFCDAFGTVLTNAAFVRKMVDLSVTTSHSIKSPLTKLVGCVELMKKKCQVALKGSSIELDSDFSTKWASKADFAYAMLMNTITKLASSNQLLWGTPRGISPEDHPVRKLLESAVDDWRDIAEINRGIKIVVDSEIPWKARYYFDWSRLMMAVTNLVENAVKYSHFNETVRINLRKEKLDKDNCDVLAFYFTDYGIGIDKADNERIFRPLEQGRVLDRKRFIPGNGMGLAIAKQAAQAHHGDIEFTQILWKGNPFTYQHYKVTFKLWIPAI
ncbi:MAG: HAMP domain-containing histidine kinase [Planctomycetes bacterium]|nr:HAMP domain-containing histidine kinase [Planctomycetota bacterium]